MSIRGRAVVFDLDGTLLDTLADLGESMNEALAELGMPGHPMEHYKRFVGDGMRNLARRVLPLERSDGDTLERCIAAMLRIYGRRWDRKTRPYHRIPELLAELDHRRIGRAVLSNKPHDLTRAIIERYFGLEGFVAVEGAREGVARKPDPAAARSIADRLGHVPAHILYVGDTDTDMRTAVAAGMVPVGAAWGFRSTEELTASGARAIVQTPLELLTWLEYMNRT